jgi:hypothetical protein
MWLALVSAKAREAMTRVSGEEDAGASPGIHRGIHLP